MAAMASAEGTVIFASVGRSHYGFDVFSCDPQTLQETLLTDGISVNFNAQFVDDPVALQLAAAGDGAFATYPSSEGAAACDSGLVYVSERTGSSSLFFNPLSSKTSHGGFQAAGPVLGPLKGADVESGFYYCDKPSVANGRAIYASTKTSKQGVRKSTTGVFSTCLKTGETVRLSPEGIADYSPAVSPSKEWVIVASDQGEEWSGAIHELDTALCIFRVEDGSRRKLVVEHGGWPTWADDSTIFFHKKAAEDDWWSVYKVVLPKNLNDLHGKPLKPERVTPPGVHAFTPAASTTGNWIAVATRRPSGSKHRHVEIFDLASKSFVPVTHKLHPELHHFNPFVCPSGMLGYHRPNRNKKNIPLLEPLVCTPSNVTLLRIDGAFPSVSPDGSLIAYNTDFEAEDSGVFVAKLDGSGRKRIFKGLAFTTSWDGKRPGVVYTSVGNIFAEERATVHILSLTFDVAEFHKSCSSSSSDSALSATTKVLTKPGSKNNAFPCASPDGKHIVFRSGRSGHKNLYIMDAEEGEEAGIRALTVGAWVDTMPSWSPDGQWIGFSSTRDDTTGTGTHFGLYLVRPDGTDLHRVLPADESESESGHPIRGRFNHVCFSPDSRSLLFTADSAAVSAEPISVANQFQPYGELFSCNLDGSGLVRWTHNAYEDGTPCWGPIRIDPKSLSDEGVELNSDFQDCLWLNNVTEKMKQAAASVTH